MHRRKFYHDVVKFLTWAITWRVRVERPVTPSPWRRSHGWLNYDLILMLRKMDSWNVICKDSPTRDHKQNLIYRNSVGKIITLQWHHNERDGVSIHQPHECLLKCLFSRWSKKNQSSASLPFVCGECTPHKWPVTRKMFPFIDVIMITLDIVFYWKSIQFLT